MHQCVASRGSLARYRLPDVNLQSCTYSSRQVAPSQSSWLKSRFPSFGRLFLAALLLAVASFAYCSPMESVLQTNTSRRYHERASERNLPIVADCTLHLPLAQCTVVGSRQSHVLLTIRHQTLSESVWRRVQSEAEIVHLWLMQCNDCRWQAVPVERTA